MKEGNRHLLITFLGTREDDIQRRVMQVKMAERFGPYGFDIQTHGFRWNQPDGTIDERLLPVKSQLEEYKDKYDYISALGPSAGGLAAVASMIHIPDITKAVAISSPLLLDKIRQGDPSPATKVAHQLFPYIEKTSTIIAPALAIPEVTKHIFTYTVSSGDEQVPLAASQVPGGENHVLRYHAFDHNDGTKKILRTPTCIRTIVDFLHHAHTRSI